MDRQFDTFPEEMKKQLEKEAKDRKKIKRATSTEVGEDVLKDCDFFNQTPEEEDDYGYEYEVAESEAKKQDKK